MPELKRPSGLKHFPISLLALVMGLTGLTIAWQKTQHVLGMDLRLGQAALTLIVFYLLYRTAKAVSGHRVCVPDG
jgi:tellurite resistance protein